ncbi:MAG: FeoA domain-containing protein, partial [Treponema sp.]|nr:FeoA domain-containing protein [Treponema sp.]
MTLKDLPIGQTAEITKVGGNGELRQHFLDMGVIPGTSITKIKLAPMGDPIEFELNGYELTMRVDDAGKIEVSLDETPSTGSGTTKSGSEITKKSTKHPGLGEGGKFHAKDDGDPLPAGTTLTYALVGNQNSGKTTLFNQLTGANQHVGNFPGVTVDRKDGAIRRQANTLVTDLPGIYSMSPYTSEEIISRNFVLNEKPRGI